MSPPRIKLVLTLTAALLTLPAATFADPADDQFAVAAGHYAARRWDLAVEEFQKFLTEYPEHGKRTKAFFFCGEALVQSSKFAEAQAQFDAVLKADSHGRYARQALFRAGECAFWAEKSDDAAASLARFCEQYADDPLNTYALSYLGQLSLQAGDDAAAKIHYTAAIERFADGPTADDCRLGLAQAHLALHEYRQAEEVLKVLIAAKRLTVEAHYWLGQVFKAEEQWDNAANAFQAALAADPNHKGAPTLRYQTAESFIRAKQFQAAIDFVHGGSETPNVEPLPATHRYLIALAQQGLSRHDDALATLGTLAAHADKELALNVLLANAASLLALDRQRDAIGPLNEYLTASEGVDPGQRERAAAQLALCYARAKDFERAKAMVAQLAAGEPRSELYWTTTLQLAQLAATAQESDAARAWFAAAAGEQVPAEIAAKALAGLAQLAADAEELETAAGFYERLLERHPDGEQAVSAALACGELRERLEQYDAALAMYHLVIERLAEAEQLPQALLRAASLCDRLSQEAKAIEHYERLTREFEDSDVVPAAIYGWAWCLRELKRDAEANEKFEQLRREHSTTQYWADAIYRLALFAAQSQQLDRAVELLGELIKAGELAATGDRGATEADASTESQGGAQATATDEDDDNQAPAVKSTDSATLVPQETLQHALYLRAQVAITLTKWDDAARDLEQLMHKHRRSALALPAEFLRADVAYRRGDYEDAGKRFAALAPRLERRSERWIGMVALRRAQVLAQQKRWSEARQVAESIEMNYPAFDQQFEADYLIGRAHAAEANLHEARTSYVKVVRSPQGGKTETAAMAQWMIGESYLLQEQYAAAVREYLRAEVLYAYPHWQAAALLQAGKCYEQLGQWKNAGDAYGRLLKLYSQTQFAAEARDRLQGVQAQTASRPRSM